MIQGVPQIQDVPQNRSTSPIQPNQTGFGRNKNRKTFNSVLAVDTATQVCGMVTNMSMNVTCCKLLAFRASLTTVYWYLRKSMCVTHVSVLVPYGSRCTSVKYK